MMPNWPDSGIDMRKFPFGSKPDDERKDEDANSENQGMDDPMERKGDKVSEIDLSALERDLMVYYFNETERGGANETFVLMTPSPFMSPTKEPLTSLSPVEPMSLMKAHQRRDTFQLI